MLDWSEIASCFMILFAVIDIIGSIPVILNIKNSVGNIQPITIIAGAGTFSTLISLGAEYQQINILVAIALNMPIIFIVLRLTGPIEKFLGMAGINVLEKVFGIILLAIAVKLFSNNIQHLLH
jgi:multiple antibiotic resistance protein